MSRSSSDDTSVRSRLIVDHNAATIPARSDAHNAIYEIHVKGEGARRAVLVTMHSEVESPVWLDIETDNCLLPARVSKWREL